MTEPILHSRTKLHLEDYLQRPAHGLILSGADGIGKYHIATWLASELKLPLQTIEPLDNKKVISIEQVRELYRLTRTGTPQLLIIKDAHMMSHGAQNSFLKLLEEPPKHTYFILTTPDSSSLLATIRSRCQTIEVITPLKNQLQNFVLSESEIEASEIQALLFTTEGKVGDFSKLLHDRLQKESHQQNVHTAKQFYAASTYQRHLILIEHKFDKKWASEIISLLSIIIATLLRTNIEQTAQKKKLIRQSELLQETAKSLLTINGNPKIHLTKLAQEL